MSQSAPGDNLSRTELRTELRSTAARGGAVTLLAQWASFALRFGSTLVLARLLTPADYGLVAMVVAITGLAELVKDLGLGMATIQRDDLRQAEISALFWVNVAFGLLLAALTAAAAPLVALFYGEPDLVALTLVLSLSVAVGALGVQHQALLARRMEFARIAKADVLATAVGVVCALLSAAAGAGYWALVVLQLVIATTRTALAWHACAWRPDRPAWAPGAGRLVAFGGNLSGYNALNYLARNLDNVLIGRFVGAGALGLYSRAYQLLLLPIQQINGPVARVAIPTLSTLQSDHERYRRCYVRALGALSFVTLPLLAFTAASAEEIVVVALGPSWREAAPIFEILALAGIVQTVGNTTGWLYLSLGRGRRQLVWGLVSRPLILVAFVVGLQWGVTGVAAAYAAVELLLAGPMFAYAVRGTPVGMRDVGAAVWRPAVLGAMTYALGRLAGEWAAPWPAAVRLALVGTLTALCLIAVVAAWPGARREARPVTDAVRGFASRYRRSVRRRPAGTRIRGAAPGAVSTGTDRL